MAGPLSEGLCPACGERPRAEARPGKRRRVYCAPCSSRKSMESKRRRKAGLPAPPGPARAPRPTAAGEPKAPIALRYRPTATSRAKDQAIATGRRHVIAEVSYSEGHATCSCGHREEVDVSTGYLAPKHGALAEAMSLHVAQANKRPKADAGDLAATA